MIFLLRHFTAELVSTVMRYKKSAKEKAREEK